MKRRVTGWKADFPIPEVVEGFARKLRRFVINCYEGWEFELRIVDSLE